MNYKIITLTQGNINNSHLYLTDAWELIPSDAIGGPRASDAAPENVEVHFGIGAPVSTDVAEDKKIFRKRTWVREFFEAHSLSAGSKVVVERTASHRFHVYPAR